MSCPSYLSNWSAAVAYARPDGSFTQTSANNAEQDFNNGSASLSDVTTVSNLVIDGCTLADGVSESLSVSASGTSAEAELSVSTPGSDPVSVTVEFSAAGSSTAKTVSVSGSRTITKTFNGLPTGTVKICAGVTDVTP